MPIQTVNVTLPVPKETKEVVDALGAIYAHVKAKKPLSQLGELFDELTAAVGGVDQIDDEMKSQYRDEAAGYLVHIMMEQMMPVKIEAAPVEPA